MQRKSNLFTYSLMTTIVLIAWTSLLPSLYSRDWFSERWIYNMWIGFDIVLCVFMACLTFGISLKKEYVAYLSPVIFGMVLTDWIFNVQLWIYGGFDYLEPRFIIAYIFALGLLVYFFFFTRKVMQETKG